MFLVTPIADMHLQYCFTNPCTCHIAPNELSCLLRRELPCIFCTVQCTRCNLRGVFTLGAFSVHGTRCSLGTARCKSMTAHDNRRVLLSCPVYRVSGARCLSTACSETFDCSFSSWCM